LHSVYHTVLLCALGPGGGGRGSVVSELRKGERAVVRGQAANGDAIVFDDNLDAPLSTEDAPSYTVSGLRALTLYQFRVRATNRHGPGPWSSLSERVRTSAVRAQSFQRPMFDQTAWDVFDADLLAFVFGRVPTLNFRLTRACSSDPRDTGAFW
jgi:hypothetical protein